MTIQHSVPFMKRPRIALMRAPSSALVNCQSEHAEKEALNWQLALEQWQHYQTTIQGLVDKLIVIPTDPQHPDCCFVEDTCVVVGDQVLLTRPGHPSRRGEVTGVREALKSQIPFPIEITEMQEPACLDGGDVLFTGRHLFVGQSNRTNQAGIDALKKWCTVPVFALKMAPVLHLKCLITYLTNEHVLIHDSEDGRLIHQQLMDLNLGYQVTWIPDLLTANILSFPGQKCIIYQQHHKESEQILQKLLADLNWTGYALNMSETSKADGALTCLSVLM